MVRCPLRRKKEGVQPQGGHGRNETIANGTVAGAGAGNEALIGEIQEASNTCTHTGQLLECALGYRDEKRPT